MEHQDALIDKSQKDKLGDDKLNNIETPSEILSGSEEDKD